LQAQIKGKNNRQEKGEAFTIKMNGMNKKGGPKSLASIKQR
jgi:hypothetical protein